MKTSTFLIAATLIASLQTIPVWAKGGEGSNTGCNGVGNPNSPCAPSGGAGGSSSIGDVKNTNDNTNANNNLNTNSNNNLNTSTGIGVGVGVGTGGAGGEGGRGGRGGDAASDASANAAGGNATGGNAQGGQGGSAKSYSALSNDIDASTRSISFAAPAWTVIPTAAGCVVSSSRAWSAVFGFASYSGSQQASDAVCVMVGMAAAAQNACQYKTAAIVNRRVFESLNPGESGEFFEQLAQADLSPVDCALLVKYAR